MPANFAAMEAKSRPRKKRGAERNPIASPNHCDDEMWRLACEKEELEFVVKDLTEKLGKALSKLYLQDDLIKKHEMMVADSVAGWEEAEAKVFSLKQELDESHHERIVREERMACLESALTECMQQLHFAREEQKKRISLAVMKSQTTLKLSLEEVTSALNRTRIENGKLGKALLEKTRVESEMTALASLLESAKKENASLKYELRHLQSEHAACHASESHSMLPSDSVAKLIELLEGIKPVPTYCSTGAASEFAVRIFQWKASELRLVSDRFVQTCYDLKNGDTDASRFVEEVGDALEWVMNHCFSIQDVPSMKHDMMKRFEWDDNASETRFDVSKRETHDTGPKVSCFSEESENRSCCSEEIPAKSPELENKDKIKVGLPIERNVIYKGAPEASKSSLRHKMMEEDETDLAQNEDKKVNYKKSPPPSFISNDVLDHLEKILKENTNGLVGSKNGGLWKKIWRKMKST